MYNNQAPRINNQYPQSNQFSNTNQNNQTSSAVPFSSQSYPNNPETPGYPQKNPQQQTMAEKYPLQIWVAARAGMSLTCAADLRSPEEKDMPAYTIPIKERNCKNKIVAEVLLIQLKNIQEDAGGE